MRGVLFRLALIASVLLAVFLLAGLADVRLFSNPIPLLQKHQQAAALLSFGLLAADVVLPVPSSLLMIANGGLFGFLPGALLSTAASVASSCLGFRLGRSGRRLMANRELGTAGPAEAWLRRWGALAIAASRPVPLLAESVSIVAGTTSSVSWRTLVWSSLAGSAPAALVYAYAGSRAVEPAGAGVVFFLTLLLAGALWWIGYRRRPRPA